MNRLRTKRFLLISWAASWLALLCVFLLMIGFPGTVWGQVTTAGVAPQALFDPAAAGSDKQLSTANPAAISWTVDKSGINVSLLSAPGPSGVAVKPADGTTWNLSAFGHIEAKLTNSSTLPMTIHLRLDNPGPLPNKICGNSIKLKPGESGTLKVIFGTHYGMQTASTFDPAEVSQVLLSTDKAAVTRALLVADLMAAGTPDEKAPPGPVIIPIVPKDGVLLGPGAEPLTADKNLIGKVASPSLIDSPAGQSLKIVFPAGSGADSAGIKPGLKTDSDRWGLINGTEVRAKVRNDGTGPITPSMTVDSDGSPIHVTSDAPLAPGAESELVVSYLNPKIWKNISLRINDPSTGNTFTSNRVAKVLFSTAADPAERILTVESIKADLPPYSAPDWLGQRPPVEGEWTKTFDEEFEGKAIDLQKWHLYMVNSSDEKSHFSKDNVRLDNGVAKLHFEKKNGCENDDPSKKQTEYAAGFLGTYGKWGQRYGYFEARMKLPTAPGLRPAFWLMPDRSSTAGVESLRTDTQNGGMEFDIVDFISGWGACRYNIAMHWDEGHKSAGSTVNYVQPDKDGYITSGLLWTPGSAIYYCNGQEILHYENPQVSSVPAFILLDMVSGGTDNLSLEDAKLPDDFVIDYVRVWQRKDLASDVDGAKTNKGELGPLPDPVPPATPAAPPAK